MKDDHYKNREIDAKFEGIHTKLSEQDLVLEKILNQTTATNGKVRKIIIALVLLGGFVLGTFGQNITPVLAGLIL